MIIFAVDDEINSLRILTDAIYEAVPGAAIRGFRRGDEALSAAAAETCDVAFIDIEMPVMNGLELAKKMKLINPDINIVFATGYPEYIRDALNVRFSGYILKPVTPEKIRVEIEDLRHPLDVKNKKRVRFQTFGKFEMYIDGKPIEFKYDKTKEYLACLIDRRTLCSNGEIEEILFDSNVERSYIRHLRKDLTDVLKKYGCEEIFIKQHGKQGINSGAVDCDYYDWLDGKAQGLNSYHGEYMKQYSWAELH